MIAPSVRVHRRYLFGGDPGRLWRWQARFGGGGGGDRGIDNHDDGECTKQCMLARCGDGFLQPGEICDDGNDIDTDSCRDR
ncbi:MAG: DUF4215 domain-containing protein [Myxococcota bacterium]